MNYLKEEIGQSDISKRQNDILKRQNDALECDLVELALMKVLSDKPNVTQNELIGMLNMSRRTLQRMMLDLQQKGYLKREGGKRYGHWVVLGVEQ